MKTIYFIRHAKSDWEHSNLADIDRPLNDRGFRDAPYMANFLKEKITNIDAIVTSPANRAYTTASFFADAFLIDRGNMVVQSQIYMASRMTILSLITTFPDHWNKVLLFGHNPTMTELANLFGNNEDWIDNIPTCGISQVEAGIQTWKQFSPESAQRKALYAPKTVSY